MQGKAGGACIAAKLSTGMSAGHQPLRSAVHNILYTVLQAATTVASDPDIKTEGGPPFITRFFFILTLILAGITDAATRKIPDIFPALITLTAICQLLRYPAALIPCMIGMSLLSVPMLLLASTRGGLGGGDIKLTAACGLFLGADALLTGVLFASLFALVAALVRIARRKGAATGQDARQGPCLRDTFAFGPFLAAGFIFAALL